MEAELTYLFLFVVLIGLVLCPITHPGEASRRARSG